MSEKIKLSATELESLTEDQLEGVQGGLSLALSPGSIGIPGPDGTWLVPRVPIVTGPISFPNGQPPPIFKVY
jgi:hypothetical protein